MGNIIAFVAIVVLAVGAVVYIVRAKKNGKKCIGCPDGCCPSSKKSGCSCCNGCNESKSE